MLRLKRKDFLEIIHNYEKDYEMFSLIKDKLTLYEDYKEL
jgi:hypothetical protein